MSFIDIDGLLYGIESGEVVAGPFSTLEEVIEYIV